MEYPTDAMRWSWAEHRKKALDENAVNALRSMGYTDEQIEAIERDKMADTTGGRSAEGEDE